MDNIYIYVSVIFGFVYWWLTASKRREKYIRNYCFPEALERALGKEFPREQHQAILEALREYLMIVNKANNAKFFVPSKAILKAWRAFVLLEAYKTFSQKAFGAEIYPPKLSKKIAKWTLRNAFRTVYALATKREGIERKKEKKLPSIFTLDRRLKIKNGTEFTFKKSKNKGSKRAKSRSQRASNSHEDETTGLSFTLSYSSDEYWECSIESDFMRFSISNESSMDEYKDNSSSASSDSNTSSSSTSSSSGSSWSFGDSDSGSGSSDSGGSSD